jgi:hypothetical protein
MHTKRSFLRFGMFIFLLLGFSLPEICGQTLKQIAAFDFDPHRPYQTTSVEPGDIGRLTTAEKFAGCNSA